MDRFMKLFRRGDSDILSKETGAELALENNHIDSNNADQDNIIEEQSAANKGEGDGSKMSKRDPNEEQARQQSFTEVKMQAVKRLARRTKQLLYDNFMSYQESQEKEPGDTSPTSDVFSQKLDQFKDLAAKNQQQTGKEQQNQNGSSKHGSFEAGHKAVNIVLVDFWEDQYLVQWKQEQNSEEILEDTIYKLKDIKKNAYHVYVRFLETQFLKNIQEGEEDLKDIEGNQKLSEMNEQQIEKIVNDVFAENSLDIEEAVQSGKSKSTEKADHFKQQSQQSQGRQGQQQLKSPVLSQRQDHSQNIIEKETVVDENSQERFEDMTKKRFQNAGEYYILKVNGQQQQNGSQERRRNCLFKDDAMEDEDGDKFYSTEQRLEEEGQDNKESYSEQKDSQTTGQIGNDNKKDNQSEKKHSVADKNEQVLTQKRLANSPREQNKEEKKHEDIEKEEQEQIIPEKNNQFEKVVQDNRKGFEIIRSKRRSCNDEDDERNDCLVAEVEEEQIRQEELTQERLKRQAKMTFYLDNKEDEEMEKEEEDNNTSADRKLQEIKDPNVTVSQNQRVLTSQHQLHASAAELGQQQQINQKQIGSKHLLDSITSQDHFNPIGHRKHSYLKVTETNKGENQSYIKNEVQYTLRDEESSPKNDGNDSSKKKNQKSNGNEKEKKDNKDLEVEEEITIEETEQNDELICKGLKGQKERKVKRSKRIEESEEGEKEDIEGEEDKDEDSEDDFEKDQNNEDDDEDDEEQEGEQDEDESDDDEKKFQKEMFDKSKQYRTGKQIMKATPNLTIATISKDSRVTPINKNTLIKDSKPTTQVNSNPSVIPKIPQPQPSQDKLTTIKSFTSSLANPKQSQSHNNIISTDSSSKMQDQGEIFSANQKLLRQIRISTPVSVPRRLLNINGRQLFAARKSAPINFNPRFRRRNSEDDENEDEDNEESESEEEEDNDQEDSEDDDDSNKNKFDEEELSGQDL